MGTDPWAAYALDPRDPGHAHLRAADQDRAVTCQLLAEAYAEGRLDLHEHDERAEAAQQVRTLGELVPLLADLVPLVPPAPGSSAALSRASRTELERRAQQEWAKERRAAVMGFVAPSLITSAVFLGVVLATPAGWHFPWPLVVMAVTLANLVRVHVQRRDIVEDRLASLERKQAKALAKQAKARPALGAGDRERLDPEAVRAATELARRKAREAARAVEQDVVRRVNQRFRPPPAP